MSTILERLGALVEEAPAAAQLSFWREGDSVPVQAEATRAEVYAHAVALKSAIDERAETPETGIILALPNCLQYFPLVIAAWMSGRHVLLMPSESAGSSPFSGAASAGLFESSLSISQHTAEGCTTLSELESGIVHAPQSATELTADIPPASVLLLTGGTTGTPKLVRFSLETVFYLSEEAARAARGRSGVQVRLRRMVGDRPEPIDLGSSRLIAGDLYHTGNFFLALGALLDGALLTFMERFNPAVFWRALADTHATFTHITPSAMRTAASAYNDTVEVPNDVILWHGASPCAPELKRFYLRLLRPENVLETYGSTELAGISLVTGEEWLRRPGTVGRPHNVDIKIIEPTSNALLGPGSIGEIYVRSARTKPAAYVGGQEHRLLDDGFVATGDLGWLDADGYLYVVDRRDAAISWEGNLVSLAEIENLILGHGDVADAGAVNLPDGDSDRLYIMVIPSPDAREGLTTELHSLAQQLVGPVPVQIRATKWLPRTGAGKLQRYKLADLWDLVD